VTGLVYAQQRDYDPQIGRFLGPDPLAAGFADGGNFNRYGYANDNPYRFTDPDGREVVINIERDAYSDNSVTSRVTAISDRTERTFSGYALEDARGGRNRNKDPLQAGSYSGSVRTDGKRGWRVELEPKNNYRNVQLHVGNTAKDVEGCFAVGTSRSEDFVGGSKKAMSELRSLVEADGSGKITINVHGRGATPTGEPQVFRVEGRIDSRRHDKE
jgi:RHS repeat-associated protein